MPRAPGDLSFELSWVTSLHPRGRVAAWADWRRSASYLSNVPYIGEPGAAWTTRAPGPPLWLAFLPAFPPPCTLHVHYMGVRSPEQAQQAAPTPHPLNVEVPRVFHNFSPQLRHRSSAPSTRDSSGDGPLRSPLLASSRCSWPPGSPVGIKACRRTLVVVTSIVWCSRRDHIPFAIRCNPHQYPTTYVPERTRPSPGACVLPSRELHTARGREVLNTGRADLCSAFVDVITRMSWASSERQECQREGRNTPPSNVDPQAQDFVSAPRNGG